MGEFTFKTLAILIIAVVAFVAFKAGSWFGGKDKDDSPEPAQTTELVSDIGKHCSVEITDIDFDATGDKGEHGMNIRARVILSPGQHSYKLNVFFYDEDGPLKDENGMYNIKEYVGVSGELGEYNIKENNYQDIDLGFFFPYDELHLKQYGEIALGTTGRLIQDNSEIVADAPVYEFTLIRSK